MIWIDLRARKAIAHEKRETREREIAERRRNCVFLVEAGLDLRATARVIPVDEEMEISLSLSLSKRYDDELFFGKRQPCTIPLARRERERERETNPKEKIKRTVLHTENSYSPTGSCERTLIVSVFSFAADIFLFYLCLLGFFFFFRFWKQREEREKKNQTRFLLSVCVSNNARAATRKSARVRGKIDLSVLRFLFSSPVVLVLVVLLSRASEREREREREKDNGEILFSSSSRFFFFFFFFFFFLE